MTHPVPIVTGTIDVTADATEEEWATLDRADDVERLDALEAKIGDEIERGLAAISVRLLSIFGDEITVEWKVS